MIQVRDLGLVDYQKALLAQEASVASVMASSESEVLLLCEHPKVITVGRAPGSNAEVFDKNIPLFEVSRGGRSTLHLPGQIVVYPVLDLQRRGRDLHGYMRILEKAIIETLADFRIEGTSLEGKTGVWVPQSRLRSGPKKVASIGVAVKKWVCYHGLALNVNCDLSLFKGLNPCGFSSDVMTSMIVEMKEEYRKTWGLSEDTLFLKVKMRLVENLIEGLE